jgi:CBS domain containing-hemolysin-like protein
MNLLTKKRKSVAVVIDEYGGTSGIITIEDIVESFEIEDEHDSNEELIEKTWVMGFYFSTRFDVEYLNNTYKFAIPESDSLWNFRGFIVDFTKEIPQKGEVITIVAIILSLKRPQIRK